MRILFFLSFYFTALISWSQDDCFRIASILVDACGTPEAENEMMRLKIGAQPQQVDNLIINWPSNDFLGICQNATTANKVAQMNSSVVDCGYFLEPVNGVLPPFSNVLVITSTLFDPSSHNYAGLQDTIYVLFQCPGNSTFGHFANWIEDCTVSSGNRTTVVSFGSGCTKSVTYNRCFLTNQNGGIGGSSAQRDGARVDFNLNGTLTYVNDGCTLPYAELSQVLRFANGATSFCEGDEIQVIASISGIPSYFEWSSQFGWFDNNNQWTTIYTPDPSMIGEEHYIYFSSLNGCGDLLRDSLLVVINKLPELTLLVETSAEQCGPGSVQLEVLTSNNFSWNTGETTSIIFPQESGEYTVTAQNQCGSVTELVRVDLEPDYDMDLVYQKEWCRLQDDATIKLKINNGIPPYEVTYRWNGIIYEVELMGNELVINIDTQQIGEQLFELISLSDAREGCEQNFNEVIVTEVVALPELNVSYPSKICSGETADLTFSLSQGKPPFKITYQLNNGSAQEIVVNDYTAVLPLLANTEGTIVLTINTIIEGANGCETLFNQNYFIEVVNSPTAFILGDTTVCQYAKDIPVQFYADAMFAPYVFTYQINDGLEKLVTSDENGSAIIYLSANSSEDIVVSLLRVSSANLECEGVVKKMATISVLTLPELDFSFHPTILHDDFNVLYLTNHSNFSNLFWWNFGDDSPLDSTYHTSNVYDLGIYQDYPITLYGENEIGCRDSLTQWVTYAPLRAVYLPNSFTPNGDGLNDCFRAVITEGFEFNDYSLEIYNRWGELIFQGNTPEECWDGQHQNKDAPEGIYVWKLRLTHSTSAYRKEQQGTITLLR